MNAATDRLAFAPPPQPGMLRAFTLAIVAHLLLVLALMYGLRWQRDSQVVAAEAELWSRLPQEAAPKEVPAPPPPPPQPEAKPVPRVEPPPNRDAEIALEREKREKEREAAERRQAELERERDRQRKLEAQRKKEEQEALRQKQQEQARVAEAKRKAEEEKQRRQQEQEAQRVAKLREDNLKRMQAMANGTGAPSATGAAARASGPSASYAGRIAALIKSNTRFTDTVSGDPAVEVELRLAPDGTIVGQRVIKSSGNRQRDEAVLRGIEATGRIPRDTDGRIFTPMIVSVRQFG